MALLSTAATASPEPSRANASGVQLIWGIRSPIIAAMNSTVALGRRRTRRVAPRAAFTLIELLVVMVIIGILLGLLLPAIMKAVRSARRASVLDTVKQLESAWNRYYSEYSVWPESYVKADGDATSEQVRRVMDRDDEASGKLATPNAVKILAGDLNVAIEDNPRRIGFMGFHQKSREKGVFTDIYGKPFYFVLDTRGYDNQIEFNRGSIHETLRRNVAVWSAGPDKKNGTKDDILSWSY
jgi:prepilin-type N-terminal cleavage/methylation domain-containing protein